MSEFIILAQAEDQATLDYTAVIRNKALLRAWSDSDWPSDDFSYDENLDDMRGHIGDAREGTCFAYNVFSPKREAVLGSIYVFPTAHAYDSLALDETSRQALASYSCRVEYWLRRDRVDVPSDSALTAELTPWLEREHGGPVVFGARATMPERSRAYENLGLRLIAAAPPKDGGSERRFYGR